VLIWGRVVLGGCCVCELLTVQGVGSIVHSQVVLFTVQRELPLSLVWTCRMV